MQVAHDGDRFVCRVETLGNPKVFRVGEMQRRVEHGRRGPVHQALPHLAHEDQRDVVGRAAPAAVARSCISLQHGADASRGDDEGVRGDHEVVQPGEERLVLERLLDEGIDVLLER